MPFDDKSYVDPFSTSAGNEQMGSGASSPQISSHVDRHQMGENDLIGRSTPETLSERYARWSPEQPNSQSSTKQMGGWTCSGQQMG